MCNYPLKGFPIGLTDNGKTKYLRCSFETEWIRFDGKRWIQYPRGEPFGDYVNDYILQPCGQCTACRISRARDWANRCMLEMQSHDEAWFVTLTYDDDHLPPAPPIVDLSSGVIEDGPIHTLVKDECAAFMKRLRKNTGQELRVYGCGEYGGRSYRPHYHLIIFGLHLDDLKVYKSNFEGDVLYNSPTIDKAWQYKGYCVIGEANWNSMCYVSRYVTKKYLGKHSDYYTDLGIVPPYSVSSRRPGIGRLYYDENFEKIYKYDKIVMSTKTKGMTFNPPKYFDRLHELNYPDEMASIKEKRRENSENVMASKLAQTDLDYMTYCDLQEQNLLNRLGKIKERSSFV